MRATNGPLARLVVLVAAIALAAGACGDDTDGSVSFVEPTDGAEVTSPVTVQMEAEGVEIEPADAGVNEGAGHLHIVIDSPCVDEGEVIPNDDFHRHFGDGSTQTELELEPGEHSLCLQLADGAHVATDLTHEITVTVTE